MILNFVLTTERLFIEPLSTIEDDFILELVNTEGWIKFIGNRNITSKINAANYIQKILNNKNLSYWVVKLKESRKSIGIITFIKRDYLEHNDIGFAFLPTETNKGFAYEATIAVLEKLIKVKNLKHILATTIPENENSIKLLNKIGLIFTEEIEIDTSKIQVFGISTNQIINKL